MLFDIYDIATNTKWGRYEAEDSDGALELLRLEHDPEPGVEFDVIPLDDEEPCLA